MSIKDKISKSDYIISFGSFLAQDNIEVQEAIIEAIAKNSAEFIYMHPIDNVDLKVYYSQFIKYEVGSEEGICALLLDAFANKDDEKIKDYIDELDIGYISAESSAGEEEFEEAYEKGFDKQNKILIVGRDILDHSRKENIINLLALLKKSSDLQIVCLDEEIEKLLSNSTIFAEEVEELDSYNGTIVYRVYGEKENNLLIGSESFSRIAKVNSGDDIVINCGGEKIAKRFEVNKDLYGTVALCPLSEDDTTILSQGYRYKQVKIEKVDA